ncbi:MULTISPECIES: sensor histidine kinase [unclassified Duganella]|uniref:sensor histidine kinase n=1 Tax=unclassified Duganella TaxID=2636909 RepID=UPI0006F5FA49|nr:MULTISPECIES: histidine kinase [unclassified Duganella]KQV59825.1 histidine kinase [Duganella sp. Root336D2]KRB87304.1 histidine kinase [Duganella sp. Root198D2]
MSANTDAAELRELLGYVNNCWDDERRALSRQMHDSLGSSLTALTMHLGLLTSKLPPEPALLDRAAQMKNLLHNIIETNRGMQHKLWNDKLEFLGLRVALGELVAQFGAEQLMKAQCSLPEDEPACPRAHRVVLLRAAEEGLRNVATHARASKVDVIVDDMDDSIVLTVKDDGVGLGQTAVADGDWHQHHGLRMIRERAIFLGGWLSLAANGKQGAVLSVTLPKPPIS